VRPEGIHPTHQVTSRGNGCFMCRDCYRYTSARLAEGLGIYDAGLRQPCDRARKPSCWCHDRTAFVNGNGILTL